MPTCSAVAGRPATCPVCRKRLPHGLQRYVCLPVAFLPHLDTLELPQYGQLTTRVRVSVNLAIVAPQSGYLGFQLFDGYRCFLRRALARTFR